MPQARLCVARVQGKARTVFVAASSETCGLCVLAPPRRLPLMNTRGRGGRRGGRRGVAQTAERHVDAAPTSTMQRSVVSISSTTAPSPSIFCAADMCAAVDPARTRRTTASGVCAAVYSSSGSTNAESRNDTTDAAAATYDARTPMHARREVSSGMGSRSLSPPLVFQHALTLLSPSIPGEGRRVVGAQGRERNGTPRERLRARGPNARAKRRADDRDAREECRVSPIVRFQGMNPGRSSSGCMRPTSLTNIMFRPFRSFLTAPDRWRQTH